MIKLTPEEKKERKRIANKKYKENPEHRKLTIQHINNWRNKNKEKVNAQRRERYRIKKLEKLNETNID